MFVKDTAVSVTEVISSIALLLGPTDDGLLCICANASSACSDTSFACNSTAMADVVIDEAENSITLCSSREAPCLSRLERFRVTAVYGVVRRNFKRGKHAQETNFQWNLVREAYRHTQKSRRYDHHVRYGERIPVSLESRSCPHHF